MLSNRIFVTVLLDYLVDTLVSQEGMNFIMPSHGIIKVTQNASIQLLLNVMEQDKE